MPRLARVRFALAIATLIVLAVAHGSSQDAVSIKALVQTITAPAIDRGVAPDLAPLPRNAKSIRPAVDGTVRVDRIGRFGASYVPGRVIVRFKDDASAGVRTAALRQASPTATMSAASTSADFSVVAIDAGEDAETVAQSLASAAGVEYAQAAYRVHPYFVPNDPLYSCATASSQCQWNFPAIDLERAWDIQAGASTSIVVAVLDTGIAYQNAVVRYQGFPFQFGGVNYPALGPVDVPFAAAPELGPSTRFVSPHDFVWNDDLPFDTDGHGTHVAGTVGQLTNNGVGTAGVAFNVRLMPVKVLDSQWDDIFGAPFSTDDTVALGIRYAADHGANILNMSLGRNGPAAPVIESAIRYAVSKGCFISISGGNSFQDGNPLEVVAEIASRVDGAVSVAATDRNHNRAFYSSTGNWVELAAPGGSTGIGGAVFQQTYDFRITDTFDPTIVPPAQFKAPRFDVFAFIGYAGTSMAAPHVAGVAALLMQQGIKDPAAIEAALEQSAVDRGAPGHDVEFGFGEIDARNAVRGLGLAR